MKRLLLVTTLLSIAMSEKIFMENRSRPNRVWIRDKQFKKPRQVLQEDSLSEMEELLNYDDDDNRQFPRLSDTRFVSESTKLPSLAFIRQPDKPKLNIDKPSVLISIGIQEGMKANCHVQENCSTKKNYSNKHSQAWHLQQPFYVDEPRWVEINSDYVDGSSYVDDGDPYILSRGKKIFRIKDPEQMNKLVKDYEFLNYLNKAKRPSMKSRVRRSVKVDEPDEEGRDNVRQDERARNEDQAALEVMNKRNKRSVAPANEKLAEIRRKYETHRLDWIDASLHKEIKKNATDTFSGTETKVNRDMYDDAFILSRGKKDKTEESSMENQHVDRKESVEKPWKMQQLYADRKRSTDYNDKSEISQDDAADSRLISLPGGWPPRAFVVRDHQNREKRNACEDAICVSSQPNQWLRNIEKELRHSLLLERRDKHRDSLLESLQLNEPYVISRGKKASSGQNELYSTSRTSRVTNADDRTMTLDPVARILLRMLLMAGSGCNSDNCDVNALESTADRRELAPRDRRGTLDEILARYDPYYVARGKRADPEEVLKMRIPSLWNQRDALLGEDDAALMNDGLQ